MKPNLSRLMVMVILITGLFTTLAVAQQNNWANQDNSPNFPNISPHPPARHPPANRSVSTPVPNNAFAPMPPPPMQVPCFPQACKTTSSEPSAYVGYLYKDHGAGIQLQFNGPATVGQTTYTRNDFDLQGIWLELALPVAIDHNMGFLVTGAHLFSIQPTSIQSYSLAGVASAARKWNTDVQWWEVNGAGSYQFFPSVTGIVGFRWINFAVNFTNSVDLQGFVSPSTDAATLTTNSYIPYSGLLIESKPDCRGTIKLAAYGSPILPVDFDYNETVSLTGQARTAFSTKAAMGNGYFAEGFTEYSLKRESCSIGGFVKFTVVHAERSIGALVGGINTPIDITFDRKNWILGGKIGYMF